jgi:hypothetical protein
MALEKLTRGEEILIRLTASGIGGAHYQTITEYLEDGIVTSARQNPPVQLSLAGDGDDTLSKLLGETTSAALVENEAYKRQLLNAQDQVVDLTTTIAEQKSQLEQNQMAIEQMQSSGATAQGIITEQDGRLAAYAQQVADLQVQVAQLQGELDAVAEAAKQDDLVVDDTAEPAKE